MIDYNYDYDEDDPIFYDTETCGLHGFAVLIQYAIGDGPIQLFNPWKHSIRETIELIEFMMNHPGGVVGFNLAFDQFHLCKLHTVFQLYPDWDAYPEDIIEELAELEPRGRDGNCCKPVKACDLFLHARKGPYQSTMDRHDIRIKRVPVQIAWQLANELEKRVELKDIYFARRKDGTAEKWHVLNIEDEEGKIDPDFKDVVLKFCPSSALKALAADALGETADSILLFTDVNVNRKFWPEEKGWAPFAKAIGKKRLWKKAWPEMIGHHISHWQYNDLARRYAEKDVDLTRRLYYYFESPELGDDDSELACMVATVRWRGFKIDVPKLRRLQVDSASVARSAPTAPSYARKYIFPHLSDEEKLITKGSTKKVILESLAEESVDDCPDCDGENHRCKTCTGTGEIPTEAGKRAKEVLRARIAAKEIELYDKLITAGRFHASFKVIGTLSGRMAGADKLNPQGIKSTKEVRQCFPLAFENYDLLGGDFESFEVAIADSVYDDPKLRADLMSGKKIHGLFAEALFPEEDYDSILATKGSENDLYTKGKQGVFSQIYGGTEYTLQTRLGISEDVAAEATKRWEAMYPGIKKAQRDINDAFQSMRQPGGLGTRVVWKDPANYIESKLGFRRYFTLENMICKALFDLAETPPEGWEDANIKVTRRDRQQTAQGATRSALFGAAFGIQGANVRAATNHVIQSTGAQICKNMQRRLWDLQPSGCHEFVLMPLNIHDEIMLPCKPEYVPHVTQIVNKTVESYKDLVPLIAIDWSNDLNTWANK